MESVNVEMDLRNFIRSARREVASDAAVAAQAAEAAEKEAAATGGAGSASGFFSHSNGSAAGGVLSNRADVRAAAQAFHRLFGVGPVSETLVTVSVLAIFGWLR